MTAVGTFYETINNTAFLGDLGALCDKNYCRFEKNYIYN